MKENIDYFIQLAVRLNCKSKSFTDSLRDYCRSHPKFFQDNFIVLEYLLKKHVNIVEFMHILLLPQNYGKYNFVMLSRLKHALQSSPEELYGGKEVLEKLSSHPDLSGNPQIPRRLSRGLFSDTDVDTVLLAGEHILGKINYQNDIRVSTFKNLFDICLSKEGTEKLIDKPYFKILESLSYFTLKYCCQVFCKLEEATLGQSLLFVTLIEKNIQNVTSPLLYKALFSKYNYIPDMLEKDLGLFDKIINLIDTVKTKMPPMRILVLLHLSRRLPREGSQSGTGF